MSRIRSTGTKIELLLAQELRLLGVSYRKNVKTIKGKPDFAFIGLKVAVFCDSEFWHGKDFNSLEKRIGTNSEFWLTKIRNNISRDQNINDMLISSGWTVLRYWEKDIKKNVGAIAAEIKEILDEKRSKRKLRPPKLQPHAPCNNPENLP